ncbi:MAG: DUF1559 domain-containing protein [Planctomycetia bacterium]|jgi:hypothetical protein
MVGVPSFAEVAIVFVQFVAGLSGGQMPIGIPPQPEMPVMSQVAPEECVAYMSFAGTATPDANATNQTERFMAEPQVQAFVKSIDKTIQQAINKKNDDPQNATAAYALVKQVITSPWCVFIKEVQINPPKPGSPRPPQRPLTINAGAMLCLGDAKEKAAFEKNLQTILKEAGILEKTTTVTIDGNPYHRLPLPQGTPLTWGIVPWAGGKYMLLIGVGDGAIEGILQRAKTPAPAWLTKMKKDLPIQRRATVTYVNLEAIKKSVLPLAAKENHMPVERIEMILDSFGLGNLKSLQSSTGLDETGMVELTRLETKGPLQGLAAAVVGSSLTAEDLAMVPADANVVGAIKLDSKKLYTAIRTAVGNIEPRAGMELEMQARHLARATGSDNFEELLGSFGETWVIYNSPSEGGPLLTGLTLSVEVTDTFPKTQAALENLMMGIGKNKPRAPKLAKKQYKGTEVCYLKIQERLFPFVPTWCVKDGHLFVSLTPQNICAIIDRDPTAFRSIATAPEVTKALAQKPAPTALMYGDPKPAVQVIYPVLPYVANTLTSGLRRYEDIDIDSFDMPGLSTVLPYAKPTIRTLRRTDSGIECESHSTLPGLAASSSTLPMAAVALAPATVSARTAAHRTRSMNHMKMIMLAMHNYASARKHFPTAYTVDKDGKPLLSWRVYILPYIEQVNLYEQFHLDEPWDSPHNKKLIPMMPDCLRSPMSKAGPGKTTYLTIRTDKSIFPGKEKVSIRNITDGTSHTIAVVEANDENAVIWTKPDDYVPDEKNPTKGLEGVYKNIFLAAFADGSVHSLPMGDKTTFKALTTRNGGEAVNVYKYEQRRRPASRF